MRHADPEVATRLAARGRREVVPLSPAQVSEFCGNAIELDGRNGKSAFDALTSASHD